MEEDRYTPTPPSCGQNATPGYALAGAISRVEAGAEKTHRVPEVLLKHEALAAAEGNGTVATKRRTGRVNIFSDAGRLQAAVDNRRRLHFEQSERYNQNHAEVQTCPGLQGGAGKQPLCGVRGYPTS